MILGFGRKKVQPSFKQRVASFWEWFPSLAPNLAQALEQGKTEYLTNEVNSFMNQHMPDFAWVFGPVSVVAIPSPCREKALSPNSC